MYCSSAYGITYCTSLISRSLKDVKIDNLIAPDGTSIEHRLRSLVERTADDIKLFSNVCDTYVKKRLLAKVLLASIWDAKLLEFVRLFNHRRREFESELSIHTGQGVDKDVIMTMFQQLVSPEQKELSALVATSGGVKALRNNNKINKMLLVLEETASRASSTPSAEGHRALRTKVNDADDLKIDIFEDPDAAVEKNRDVFFRKFGAQKNQIINELTLVIQREGDRTIQEVKDGPHERIRDRVSRPTPYPSPQYMLITHIFFSQFTRSGKLW